MATILLSAAGAAIGGSVGGTVAGLSSAVLGRAVGATVGKVIDQRLLGQGSEPVETGRVERFRLTPASEGEAIAQVYGRMRVGGQVIWASQFRETSTTTGGGGKGAPSAPKTTRYSYNVSLAIALCEGEIASVGRIWADGEEVSREDLNIRIYKGTSDQLPDPVIEATEGAGQVPAYRGTAYVVMDNIALERFGNRVPQFSFEVVRQEQKDADTYAQDFAQIVQGVALIPGTGEYSLATTAVHYDGGPGSKWTANVHTPSGLSDFETSIQSLSDELPNCKAGSLVVSWFGGDLRCGSCPIVPKVERAEFDGGNMPWSVSGQTRATAETIARVDDRPIYGGTPADASVVEAIRHMTVNDIDVLFYPFILMDQQQGNTLPDPWSGAEEQPHLPWRGRITLSQAPGQTGSPDGTATADEEVAAFFGSAQVSDFSVGDGVVTYSGGDDWGLRRFILHYASLCAAAGGVSSFCIGSEMRGLTQIRGALGFPAVQALRQLAADVRAILGAETRISYAADWSEYFGYQPQDGSGDRYFHLDPLWADENIDFIGIDNYMPLSDWRDGDTHLDRQAGWESIYDLDYLRANVEGGEGFDWYYHSPEAAAGQTRTEITDQAHGEPWIWRYKDLRSWWQNSHHERIGGVRQSTPTDWEPRSKPIWFTELGCAAVDKGTNQPNKFVDPKSSESRLPKYSNGQRDDFIQGQYLRAILGHWGKAANNPVSDVYDGPMIDLGHAFVWAWDVRPYPAFPNNQELWADGENYLRGHWLNGRVGTRTLRSVVEELCSRSGINAVDAERLYGVVRGYMVDQVSDARAALQPLMLRYGFDVIERDGVLEFRLRDGKNPSMLEAERLALTSEIDGSFEQLRAAEAETTGRIRVRFIQSGGDHDIVAEEAVLPDQATHAVSASDLPIAMTRAEGRQVAERWLSEAQLARDTIRFALPPSRLDLGAGDIVSVSGDQLEGDALYRIDRVEHTELQLIDAVRIEPSVYELPEIAEKLAVQRAFAAPIPVLPLFMDLPLMRGDEVPHAPHLAVTSQPWPGSVAVYSSESDDNFVLDEIIAARSVIGKLEAPLRWARPGLWQNGEILQVKLIHGSLESRPEEAVLNGANVAAIGDGTPGNWELIQFRDAELISPDTYWLSGFLRGQAGSDPLTADPWPVGSWFVLLDGTAPQIDLASSKRRIARHYRIGPARRPVDDPSYEHIVAAFDGNGLRPYAPAHVLVTRESGGAISLTWIRRTRIDGDDWDTPEVPLGEEQELYLIRVWQSGDLQRQVEVSLPAWTYSTGAQAVDGLQAGTDFDVEVAQVSARYGPGLFRRITVAG